MSASLEINGFLGELVSSDICGSWTTVRVSAMSVFSIYIHFPSTLSGLRSITPSIFSVLPLRIGFVTLYKDPSSIDGSLSNVVMFGRFTMALVKSPGAWNLRLCIDSMDWSVRSRKYVNEGIWWFVSVCLFNCLLFSGYLCRYLCLFQYLCLCSPVNLTCLLLIWIISKLHITQRVHIENRSL